MNFQASTSKALLAVARDVSGVVEGGWWSEGVKPW
jgi:hypothetical protein